MNRLPLISVLIPVYNGEKYIKECLDSIIDQTYSNLEIIIVDDGSTDSTAKICKEYVLKDKRIKFIQKENGGVSSARNTLIKAAKGDYIQFIDADDWIQPNMIETLTLGCVRYSAEISMCQFNNCNKAVCHIENMAQNEKYYQILNRTETIKKFLEHREITGSLCNKLIRVDLIKDLRFDTSIAYGEDALMIWDIIKSVQKFILYKLPLYNYRMNEASVSHSGLSSKKLTAIEAWRHITTSIPDNNSEILLIAKARFGAEMTLLLYDAIRSKKYNIKDTIRLRRIIKEQLSYMIISKLLSFKFIIFAIISAYNWKLIKFLSKVIKFEG